jgi:serine/threonine-protein kinase
MQDYRDLAPAEWAALRRLLDDALALPPAARAAWLDRLDAEQAVFRPRLRALLAHAEDASVEAALATLPKIETAQFAPLPGAPGSAGAAPEQRVGPYRLVAEIGSGGMASVWRAERDDMLQRRPVALKLPHGAWRRAGLAERMQREREILATLEHPNIARLYDAGVADDGQPYLALELVQGERIDAYCERLGLGIAARLNLFLQATRAVAHAHAHLVVHRDLKPSNILVTPAGDVKLLDFGIAKLLDQGVAHETALTRDAGRALTPEYAAPEQIAGQPVGTAADVYALGVLLFELLAGVRPYALKRGSRAELEEAIAAAEPARPSAVAPEARRRALRGDLDTIVLKALKKDPAQRYATVDAFAADIERHLAHEPVLARPDGRLYRAGRFVVRHRLVVGFSGVLAVAVLAGAGVALWQAQLARAEQRRADEAAQRALQASRIANANTTLADFLASDLASGRSTTDLVAQIERAGTMVRRQYANDALLRAHLLAGLAGRMRRIGNFERHRAFAAEAEAAAREAGDAVLVADLGCKRARDTAVAGGLDAARRTVDAALAGLEALRPPPTATVIACLGDASAIARLAGDVPRAVETAERIRRIELDAGIGATATHADTMVIVSRAYALGGRHRDAIAAAEHGIALHTRLGSAQTPSANNLRALLATYWRDGGQPARALAIQDALLADHAARGGASGTLASVAHDRVLSLVQLGRHDEALPAATQVLADARALGDTALQRAASTARLLALTGAGRLDEARVAGAETASLYAAARVERRYTARLPVLALAELALANGEPDAAQARLDEAAALLTGGEDDAAMRPLQALRARVAFARRQPDAALAAAGRALGLARAQAADPAASLFVAEALLLRAEARALRNEADAARADALEAQAQLHGSVGSGHPLVATAQRLAR